ncbi:MAG: LptA/OstA family protein [Terriglobales bacterium]|jgi:lipopolysaccharide export system protein LptA
MTINILRLRYWFAGATLLSVAAVILVYFYARLHAGSAVTELPKKIPNGVQQSTRSFSLSKSEAGHTVYTIRAERATEFADGSRQDLENVRIVVYGHQHNRFDQIEGSHFLYDPNTGDVNTKGTVHIDLQGEAVPADSALPPGASTVGRGRPDQAPPEKLQNPIHVTTTDLVFNQKTGEAHTSARVDFEVADATGWAVGAHYDSKSNDLTLNQDVHITMHGETPVNIVSRTGSLTRVPRRAILTDAHIIRDTTTTDTALLTILLRPDNTIERILGSGGVDTTNLGTSKMHVYSPDAVLFLAGKSNDVQTADLTGGAKFDVTGSNVIYGSADTAHLNFGPQNQVSKVHAQGNVRMVQPPKPATERTSAATDDQQAEANKRPAIAPAGQTVQLDAAAVDIWLDPGNQLRRAETSPNAHITLTPENGKPGEHTVITARKFYAGFKLNHLDSFTGEPDARVVSYETGQPDKISTSRLITFDFSTSGAVSKMTQRDDFRYREKLVTGGERAAWAEVAVYSPSTDLLTLTGKPRIVQGGMTTTAEIIHIDHTSGNASAEGGVKTTYNDLKPQPDGALLATDEPIHVTARQMTAQRAGGTAHYSGDARLWQGTNIIAAPVIDFDRDQRTLVAISDEPAKGPGKSSRVTTILTQRDKTGKLMPINVTSARLNYSDIRRLAEFEGGVVARSEDGTLTASRANVYLFPVMGGAPKKEAKLAGRQSSGQDANGRGPLSDSASQIDKIVADGNVVLQQPGRRATGQHLDYSSTLDEYILSGGNPQMVDAEHGTTTGATLTFHKGDDKVQVDGADSRAVTHTRAPK